MHFFVFLILKKKIPEVICNLLLYIKKWTWEYFIQFYFHGFYAIWLNKSDILFKEATVFLLLHRKHVGC